jgi:hypothetical protein
MRIRGNNPLAFQLEQIASGTEQIFADYIETLHAGVRAVPVFVFRKFSRGLTLSMIMQFVESEARFVYMQNEKVPNGRTIDGRYLGGAGLTMWEWLHVPGFLEVAIRNEAIRIRLREALKAWG